MPRREAIASSPGRCALLLTTFLVLLTAQFNAHAHSGATIINDVSQLNPIDRYDLSVQIMQSYANFTVGGALSVNAALRGRKPRVPLLAYN